MQAIERARPVGAPWFRPAAGIPIGSMIEALRAGDRWAEGSRFVKRDAGRWVWMGELGAEHGPRALVIKGRPRRALDALPDRHAIKQSIGARRLRAAGIPTSDPVALLDVSAAGGARERWLVLSALPGESLAHVCKRGGDTPGLARRAGALVRTLSDAGLFNRDHKASNVIVSPGGELGVIDTVAIRAGSGDEKRRRMLLAMCKELSGIGAMPRLAQLWRCLAAASRTPKADWRTIAAMLRDAGDTTPRVSPV